MTEASEIVRYLHERSVKPIKFQDAKYLASFDFPLDEKFRVLREVINKGGAENIYSALYFRQAFIEAESAYHKGELPPKNGSFSSVGDILTASSSSASLKSDDFILHGD